MKTKLMRVLALALLMTQFAQAAEAPSRNPAVNRRERRIAVNGWLAKGLIGENNEGYLIVRGKSSKSIESAVKDENEDRKRIFEGMSKKSATTVMAQAKAFAKLRRSEAPAGSPIQQADGSWAAKG